MCQLLLYHGLKISALLESSEGKHAFQNSHQIFKELLFTFISGSNNSTRSDPRLLSQDIKKLRYSPPLFEFRVDDKEETRFLSEKGLPYLFPTHVHTYILPTSRKMKKVMESIEVYQQREGFKHLMPSSLSIIIILLSPHRMLS